jgi:general secretion pathway protein K
MRRRLPAAQRGVALLTAVILVAIAAVVATAIAFNNAMSARRGIASFGVAQSVQIAEGAEAIAAYVLKQTATGSAPISLNGPWAQHFGPQEFEGVILEAQLEDQQGKFNINNLVDANGVAVPGAVQAFQRLLTLVGLESKWADLLVDWIDTDNEPTFPDGAEDSVYLGMNPQYRPPNMPITSVSELLALPGFGRQRYDRLVPYIAALPPGTAVNVCTAPGVVLDALTPGKQEFSVDPQQLATRRQRGCFPTQNEFMATMSQTQQGQLAAALPISQQSSFFRLHSWITIGTARFSLYSLLQSEGGQVRPILRTFGTE